MKRIVTILLLIIIMCVAVLTYAADANCAITLTANKTEIKAGDEVEVTVNVKDLQNMEITAWEATLSYDKNVFEELPVTDNKSSNLKGLGNSEDPTYNPENGKMIATSSPIKDSGSILKIKLKVKSNVAADTKTKISMTNFSVSNGETEVTAENATVSLNVAGSPSNSSLDNNSGANNSSNGNSSSSTTTQTSSTTKSKSKTIAKSNLPKAGKTDIILTMTALVFVVSIIAYIKYKNVIK